MATGSIEIIGLKDALKALDKLGKAIGPDVNGKALFSAALPIQKSIQQKAPKRSGNLAKQIKRRRVKESAVTTAVYVYLAKKGFYGRFLEYGASPHIVIKAGRAAKINGRYLIGPVNHPGVSARPFFRPGFDESAQGAILRYAGVIKREIKKAL